MDIKMQKKSQQCIQKISHNSEWIIDLNIRVIKLSKDNMNENLYDLGKGNNFLSGILTNKL